MKRWVKRAFTWALPGLLALDMAGNYVFFCHDWDTISHCWERTYSFSAVARAGCTILNYIDPGHCELVTK